METIIDSYDKVSYHYVKIGDGRITIGYMPDTKHGEKVRRFIYGITYCNFEKGDIFQKSEGRDRASTRLLIEYNWPRNDRRYSGTAEFTPTAETGFYHQINTILTREALGNDEAPRWVKDYMKKGKIPKRK